ncbi:hypothetical protein V6x_51520 [Gimesia chilikensis]|uniref:Uncharacterized protein n=1 Tax=Gimesia chilikensis TaxID=2605989 RepID=A0A517WJJ0_9PLAN|nr:hypothetical protein [Gimesia chilikensis]QDU05415.1 hypothetical protein V6x_51520 [Gimesia chilikensis]
MQEITVVTCFIGGAGVPSIGVFEGHIPPDDVPMSEVMNIPGTEFGVLYTHVASKPAHNSLVQSRQMALAEWKRDGYRKLN